MQQLLPASVVPLSMLTKLKRKYTRRNGDGIKEKTMHRGRKANAHTGGTDATGAADFTNSSVPTLMTWGEAQGQPGSHWSGFEPGYEGPGPDGQWIKVPKKRGRPPSNNPKRQKSPHSNFGSSVLQNAPPLYLNTLIAPQLPGTASSTSLLHTTSAGCSPGVSRATPSTSSATGKRSPHGHKKGAGAALAKGANGKRNTASGLGGAVSIDVPNAATAAFVTACPLGTSSALRRVFS
jgi:hypothetical protein